MERRIVRGITSLLVPFMAACATPHRFVGHEAPNCSFRVCVEYEDVDAERIYRVVNREPVPATVELTFRTVTNLRPDVALPVEVEVAPESSAVLVRLQRVIQGRSIGAEPRVVIDLGSHATEPDADFIYAVPFGGSFPRTLVQGFHGTETHIGSMRFALDFATPLGTPVLAARDGTVIYVQDGFQQGGADPDLLERANLVVVAHSDGTMASYGHLAPGIPVAIGTVVVEGDRLGSSGATGFAGQPHLHFHVGSRLMGDPGRTIPVALRDQHGRPVALTPGSMIPPGRIRGEG